MRRAVLAVAASMLIAGCARPVEPTLESRDPSTRSGGAFRMARSGDPLVARTFEIRVELDSHSVFEGDNLKLRVFALNGGNETFAILSNPGCDLIFRVYYRQQQSVGPEWNCSHFSYLIRFKPGDERSELHEWIVDVPPGHYEVVPFLNWAAGKPVELEVRKRSIHASTE